MANKTVANSDEPVDITTAKFGDYVQHESHEMRQWRLEYNHLSYAFTNVPTTPASQSIVKTQLHELREAPLGPNNALFYGCGGVMPKLSDLDYAFELITPEVRERFSKLDLLEMFEKFYLSVKRQRIQDAKWSVSNGSSSRAKICPGTPTTTTWARCLERELQP